eukprot:4810344-Heterocapsa_arctica.AAC.1
MLLSHISNADLKPRKLTPRGSDGSVYVQPRKLTPRGSDGSVYANCIRTRPQAGVRSSSQNVLIQCRNG